MKSLALEYTDKEVTPWEDMILFREMLERINFDSIFEQTELPEQGSNRGYNPKQLIKNFLISVWRGANCFEHLEVTRQYEAIREISG